MGRAILMPRTACTKSAGKSCSGSMSEKVRLGSAFESTMRARISVPSSSTTPRARPLCVSICATGEPSADFDAKFSPGGGHGLRDRAHAAHHVPVKSLLFVIAATQQVKEQADAPCRAGTGRRVCHTRCWRETSS